MANTNFVTFGEDIAILLITFYVYSVVQAPLAFRYIATATDKALYMQLHLAKLQGAAVAFVMR
ncbi:MAG TPA: hypothetical protein GX401_08185 [Clostridiales bacterium]|nr:hypothetical protein [Clostridiales bacterium]